VISILRGRHQAAAVMADLEKNGVSTYVCAVTWGEVFAGVRPAEEEITEEFFHARGEVVLDGVAGRRAGSYLARYARSHSIEIPDALIAAAATTSGLALWTMNRKHYPMPEIQFFEP
jgi:predicted nucleic acid-binding protein